MDKIRTPLYTLPEIAKALGMTMPQLRGAMNNKKHPPPSCIPLRNNPRRYYNKQEFIKWRELCDYSH